MTWTQILAEIRARWAAREPAKALPLPPVPDWWAKRPDLWAARAYVHTLAQEGEVASGRLLVFDDSMVRPGAEALPGEVIWSDDPYVEAHPSLLDEVSERWWKLRREGSAAPGLRAMVPVVRGDAPVAIRRVPGPLASDRVVWHCKLMLYPSHLPESRIGLPIVPILRDPTHRHAIVMVVPAEWWPAVLVEAWTAATRR